MLHFSISPRKFIITSIFLTSIFLSSVIYIINITNPYNLWKDRKSYIFNTIKLEIPQEDQAQSAMLSTLLQEPEIIIIGSSRVRRGINQETASKLMNSSVLVAGLNGLTTVQAKELIRKMIKTKSIKKIFLEINFMASNHCKPISNFSFNNENILTNLLSLERIFIQTLRTIKINFSTPSFGVGYFDNSLNYLEYNTTGISRKEIEIKNSYYSIFFNSLEEKCSSETINHEEIEEIEEIIKLTDQKKIALSLMILPSSTQWETRMQKSRLQSSALNWKQKISDYSKIKNISFYDMTSITIEDTSQKMGTPLFWDELHFSNKLGDLILRKIRNDDYL